MSTSRTGTYEVTLGETVQQVRIEQLSEDGGVRRYRLTIGDEPPFEVEATAPEPDVRTLLVDGGSYDVGIVPDEEGFEIHVAGYPHAVGVVDPRRKALRAAGGAAGGVIKTQMPGRIVRLLVQPGDAVTKGTPLLVVEAMKMENEIKAPLDGVVKRFAVAEGDLVEAKSVLVEIE